MAQPQRAYLNPVRQAWLCLGLELGSAFPFPWIPKPWQPLGAHVLLYCFQFCVLFLLCALVHLHGPEEESGHPAISLCTLRPWDKVSWTEGRLAAAPVILPFLPPTALQSMCTGWPCLTFYVGAEDLDSGSHSHASNTTGPPPSPLYNVSTQAAGSLGRPPAKFRIFSEQ